MSRRVIDEKGINSISCDVTNEEQVKSAIDEIVKKYKAAGTEKVFIKANHPLNSNCSDLLSKKNADLKKILDNNNIPNETINIDDNIDFKKGKRKYYFSQIL